MENKENNFLASIHLDSKISGISFLDISTGEFYIAQGTNDYIDKLLQTYRPSEVVVQRSKRREFTELFGDKFYMSTFDDWVFTYDFALDLLTRQFSTISLKGFGIEELNQGIIAGGAALHYLAETQHDRVQHICKVSRIEEEMFVWLDKFTIRNLELINSSNEKAATLIEVIDQTISPMGARLMKRWVMLPLKDRKKIEERLDVVNYLFDNPEVIEKLGLQIRLIGDMERLITKAATGRINPREVLQLSRALRATEPIRAICLSSGNTSLKLLAGQLNPCPEMCELIEKHIHEDPPVQVNKGHAIAKGISQELDELRNMAYSGKDYLQQMLQREIERTGITSLKIGYNNVFGYFLEVTNLHKDKVPIEWNRKQTLVNAERYITEELKRYEETILGAEEKIMTLEGQLYNELVSKISGYIEPVQLNASLIARLDCLLSFATVSIRNQYVRPIINDSYLLDIKNGRHPVIEQHMPTGEKYIGNDVSLDDKNQQIIIITGPNMSGKSALLRQTALIVLMGQMGCFVPADEAVFGFVDKVFTRVGASDNISSGESTFMVEMNETASILNNISTRSLILLDEIGRGTSTYDGISIAWAIAEYLHDHPLFKAKVLFATHYHELNEMASSMKRIKNYHVAVKEIGNKVIFLRKLLPGGSEHSFGIHVARMAGMPQSVLERANQVLKQLEQSHSSDEISGKAKKAGKKLTPENDGYQLSFIQLNDPLLEQIRDEILSIDIDTLTPVEALMKLNGIKKLIKK